MAPLRCHIKLRPRGGRHARRTSDGSRLRGSEHGIEQYGEGCFEGAYYRDERALRDHGSVYFSTTSMERSAMISSSRSVVDARAAVVERCRSIQVPAWIRSARR